MNHEIVPEKLYYETATRPDSLRWREDKIMNTATRKNKPKNSVRKTAPYFLVKH